MSSISGKNYRNSDVLSREVEVPYGKQVEALLFPECQEAVKYAHGYRQNDMYEYRRSHSYEKLMDSIKQHQPRCEIGDKSWDWDPKEPFVSKANTLQFYLSEMLERDDVYLYSAAGTELDIMYGTDGWVEVGDGRGDVKIVTLDVTVNGQKKHAMGKLPFPHYVLWFFEKDGEQIPEYQLKTHAEQIAARIDPTYAKHNHMNLRQRVIVV